MLLMLGSIDLKTYRVSELQVREVVAQVLPKWEWGEYLFESSAGRLGLSFTIRE